jgi:hypothetical protein
MQDGTFGVTTFIPLFRKERIDLPLEVSQIRFPFSPDGIMDMIRHLAQAQNMDAVLPGHDAVQGEIDQTVCIGVEQHAVIGAPLVTMGQDILDKLPTLHISQHKRQNRPSVTNIGMILRKSKKAAVEWKCLACR